eukprot:30576-Eustigmatos_ZCMA.PRE.1
MALGLEGRVAHQELVHEHTQAPHVNPAVVLLALHVHRPGCRHHGGSRGCRTASLGATTGRAPTSRSQQSSARAATRRRGMEQGTVNNDVSSSHHLQVRT